MEFKFIRHADITNQELLEIVNLKSKQWNYTVDQQIRWIDENILPDDLHVIMYNVNENLAYMNLVKIEVIVNKVSLPFIGIGNVCASKKGKGYGKDIMIRVNEYLKSSGMSAMLFCKYDLVKFYNNFGWKSIDKSTITNPNSIEINIMTYNVTHKIVDLSYSGRNF